jgi:methionyl-tRNA formyltransferase
VLRVAILTSSPAGNAARITHYLARAVPEIQIVGAIVDTGARPDRSRQIDRLRAWFRHGGLSYVVWRLWFQVRPKLVRTPPRARYFHTLQDLGREFGFPVLEVPNINSPETEKALRQFDPELGVSIGNRMITPSIFSIPRDGTLNIHHGKIPEFRGGPPAFWEVYRGAATMGVSVHRIDVQLDHGELLAEAEVPIGAGEAPRAIMERAYEVDYQLLVRVLRDMPSGDLKPLAVDLSGSCVNTLPSRRELRAVRRRVGLSLWPDDFRHARLLAIPTQPGSPAANDHERPA